MYDYVNLGMKRRPPSKNTWEKEHNITGLTLKVWRSVVGFLAKRTSLRATNSFVAIKWGPLHALNLDAPRHTGQNGCLIITWGLYMLGLIKTQLPSHVSTVQRAWVPRKPWTHIGNRSILRMYGKWIWGPIQMRIETDYCSWWWSAAIIICNCIFRLIGPLLCLVIVPDVHQL